MINYLSDIPDEAQDWGATKILAVRRETIHLKHLLTEIFCRRSLIGDTVALLGWEDTSWAQRYMEYFTARLRRVYHFPRTMTATPQEVVDFRKENFFPSIAAYGGLDNIIVLDFDGVCTSNQFRELYELCIKRYRTVICTANPTVTEEWFTRRGYSLPAQIFACKGKRAKVNTLLGLNLRYDNVFYVDNEKEYLQHAWHFGINTYLWGDGRIKYFTLKTR